MVPAPFLLSKKIKYNVKCVGSHANSSCSLGLDLTILSEYSFYWQSQVYVIGRDGTMRGAVAIFEEFKRCGLRISITGISKNLDNDIDIIDKAFGFQTAVESAQ